MSDLASQRAHARAHRPSAAVVVFRPAGGRARAASSSSTTAPATSATSRWRPNPGDYRVLDWRIERRLVARQQRRPPSTSSPTSAATARRSCCNGRGRCPAAPSPARCTAGPTSGEGKLLGAPHFADKPCLDLPRQSLQKWNGMLFNGKRDVARDLATPGRRDRTSTSTATCSTSVEIVEYASTGRPSSRSTSRTTTSARSTRAWATSSPATTCAGNSATGTACRPWA